MESDDLFVEYEFQLEHLRITKPSIEGGSPWLKIKTPHLDLLKHICIEIFFEVENLRLIYRCYDLAGFNLAR